MTSQEIFHHWIMNIDAVTKYYQSSLILAAGGLQTHQTTGQVPVDVSDDVLPCCTVQNLQVKAGFAT